MFVSQRPDTFTINKFHPLANGLVFAGLGAHAGSTRYHDSSVFGNTGTLTNMESATDWVWDSTLNRMVLDVDGSNEYVVALASTVTADPVTICCWGRPDTLTAVMYAMSVGTTGGPFYGLRIDGAAAGDPVTARKFDGTTGSTVTGANSTVNTWHHWAATFESTTSRSVWLNGTSSAPATTSINNFTANRTAVGALVKNDVGSYFNGLLADCLVWTRTLTSSEIALLADRSNVMLSGLIQYPRRKWWPVAGGGTPAAFKTFWANRATQVAA